VKHATGRKAGRRFGGDRGMKLTERLNLDLREALKRKDAFRLSVLRMARASLQNAAIDKRGELDDDETAAVLAREIRKRREAAAEYRRLGKEEVAADLEREVAIIAAYLPAPLTPDELDRLVAEAVAEAQARSQRDLGKVMALLMPRLRGRADGAEVSRRVRELLPGDPA